MTKTVADGNNSILKNATIAVTASVMASDGVKNDNADSNIIFSIKDTIIYAPVVILSATDHQNLSKFHSKRYKKSVY